MSVQPIGAVAQQTQPAQSQSSVQAQDVQQSNIRSEGNLGFEPQVRPEFIPTEIAEGTKAISQEAVQKHIDNINRLLTEKNTNISMEYDSLSSPESVSIIDSKSGKVIRQLPAQAAVEIATKARDYIIGLMVDKYV